MFIVIEGPDGTGKTELANQLVSHFNDRTKSTSAVFMRQPGATKTTEALRNVIIDNELTQDEELLLFTADRLISSRTSLIPLLESGTMVIMDRHWVSSKVYQSNADSDLMSVHDKLVSELPRPDLWLFLDLSPKDIIKRMSSRPDKQDRFDSKCIGEITERRERYTAEYYRLRDNNNVKMIYADGSKEEVLDKALSAIEQLT